MTQLLTGLIRLANDNPELRKDLLPLIKSAASQQYKAVDLLDRQCKHMHPTAGEAADCSAESRSATSLQGGPSLPYVVRVDGLPLTLQDRLSVKKADAARLQRDKEVSAARWRDRKRSALTKSASTFNDFADAALLQKLRKAVSAADLLADEIYSSLPMGWDDENSQPHAHWLDISNTLEAIHISLRTGKPFKSKNIGKFARSKVGGKCREDVEMAPSGMHASPHP